MTVLLCHNSSGRNIHLYTVGQQLGGGKPQIVTTFILLSTLVTTKSVTY